MALNGKTLTRADLAEAVFEKVGLPRNEAAELVELVLKQIVHALERGESIKLSSFGSFGLRQKSERIGRKSENRRDRSDHAAPRHRLQGKQYYERPHKCGAFQAPAKPASEKKRAASSRKGL